METALGVMEDFIVNQCGEDEHPVGVFPMRIERWIRDGHEGFESQKIEDTEELLEATGRLLDRAYSHDIAGEILFEGIDGKFYAGTVEFCIDEANPEYVKEALEEEED